MSKTWLDNRHPSYERNAPYWAFYQNSYLGGPDYDAGNYLFKHPKEDAADYKARKERSVRTNHTQQIIDTLVEYLFETKPTRTPPNSHIETFWADADRQGAMIDDFMRITVSPNLEAFGIYYVVVDKPAGLAANALQERQEKLLPYAYGVSPLDMLAILYDGEGAITQALVREYYSPVETLDVVIESSSLAERYRLWMRDEWTLFEKDDKGQPKEIDRGVNPLGEVPIVRLARPGGADIFSAPSMVADIAKLDCQVYNYDSFLHQIIADQTFSTLVMPAASDIIKSGYRKIKAWVGTKAMLPVDAESKIAPHYISPDASQGTLILDVMKSKIEQIYRLKNLSSEIPDSSTGQQAQSGLSKAFDFKKLNSKLATEADTLEKGERKMARLVMLWMGSQDELPDDIADYPDTFDVKSLMDDLEELLLEEQARFPQAALKEIRKSLSRKALPKADEELLKQIDSEIDSYDPDAEEADALEAAAKLRTSLTDDPK